MFLQSCETRPLGEPRLSYTTFCGIFSFMPRRDGLPTNVEMLADFTETARQFFVATFNTAAEAGLHPGFIDKPLSSIYASDDHVMDAILEDVPGSIGLESLEVGLLGKDDVKEPLPGASWFEKPPDDLIQYRADLRRPISETMVTNGLDITDIVVPGTVSANYYAYDQELNLKRSTYSSDDRPSKANIVAGQFLADEALKHIIAQGQVMTFLDEELEYRPLTKMLQASALHDISLLQHDIALGIAISVDLPLNGHEPPEFLMRFCEAMMRGVEFGQVQIERLNDPEQLAHLGEEAREGAEKVKTEIIERLREGMAEKKAAAQRARDILEK